MKHYVYLELPGKTVQYYLDEYDKLEWTVQHLLEDVCTNHNLDCSKYNILHSNNDSFCMTDLAVDVTSEDEYLILELK